MSYVKNIFLKSCGNLPTVCVYERFNFHFEPNVLLEISSKETSERKFTAFECVQLATALK